MDFLQELTSSQLLLRESSLPTLQILVDKHLSNVNNIVKKEIKGYSIPNLHQNMITESDVEASDNPFDAYEPELD